MDIVLGLSNFVWTFFCLVLSKFVCQSDRDRAVGGSAVWADSAGLLHPPCKQRTLRPGCIQYCRNLCHVGVDRDHVVPDLSRGPEVPRCGKSTTTASAPN